MPRPLAAPYRRVILPELHRDQCDRCGHPILAKSELAMLQGLATHRVWCNAKRAEAVAHG